MYSTPCDRTPSSDTRNTHDFDFCKNSNFSFSQPSCFWLASLSPRQLKGSGKARITPGRRVNPPPRPPRKCRLCTPTVQVGVKHNRTFLYLPTHHNVGSLRLNILGTFVPYSPPRPLGLLFAVGSPPEAPEARSEFKRLFSRLFFLRCIPGESQLFSPAQSVPSRGAILET